MILEGYGRDEGNGLTASFRRILKRQKIGLLFLGDMTPRSPLHIVASKEHTVSIVMVEGRDSTLLLNVGKYLPDYTGPRSRRQ